MALSAWLERLAGGLALDPAMAELRRRFPDAPSHWLELVAQQESDRRVEEAESARVLADGLAANDSDPAPGQEARQPDPSARLDPPFIQTPGPRRASEVGSAQGRRVAGGRRARIIWAEEGVREYLELQASDSDRSIGHATDARRNVERTGVAQDMGGASEVFPLPNLQRPFHSRDLPAKITKPHVSKAERLRTDRVPHQDPAPSPTVSARTVSTLPQRFGKWISRTLVGHGPKPVPPELRNREASSQPPLQSPGGNGSRTGFVSSPSPRPDRARNRNTRSPTSQHRAVVADMGQGRIGKLRMETGFEHPKHRFPELPPRDRELRLAPAAAPSHELSLRAEQSEAIWNG